MANWAIRCSERYLSLVYDRLQKHMCAQNSIQVDETSYQVIKDGRPGDAKSYMFVYRTSEHCKDKPVILYQYGKTRSKSNIQKFLDGFSGILFSNAFSGYKSLDKNDENIYIDTVHDSEASAKIYSLVETAKANQLKISEYLKHSEAYG